MQILFDEHDVFQQTVVIDTLCKVTQRLGWAGAGMCCETRTGYGSGGFARWKTVSTSRQVQKRATARVWALSCTNRW